MSSLLLDLDFKDLMTVVASALADQPGIRLRKISGDTFIVESQKPLDGKCADRLALELAGLRVEVGWMPCGKSSRPSEDLLLGITLSPQ